MKAVSLELHIEKLVLERFGSGDRVRISQAVERELARLVGEQGVPQALAQGGAISRLDGGAFVVSAGSQPEAIGAQIALAVYKGLTR